MRKNWILVILCLSVISNVNALEVKSTTVISIQSYTNGTVGVITSNQDVGPSSCRSKAKYIVPAKEHGTSNILSVLLTAKATSKLVTINVHGTECSSGYPKITSVVLE